MTSRCTICLDHSATGVACAGYRRHFICEGCFDQHVLFSSSAAHADADELHARKARIFCPCRSAAAGGCRSEAFDDRTIAKLASWDSYRQYKAARLRVAKAERALAQPQSGGRGGTRKQVLTETQLKALFPGARMCPSCGFGPVTAYGCDNLSSHHGERWGRASISNSCPKCKHFVSRLSQWRQWDGRVHGDRKLLEEVKQGGEAGEAPAQLWFFFLFVMLMLHNSMAATAVGAM